MKYIPQFLAELAENNNRDWFQANKSRYEKEVKKPLEQFVESLIDHMQEWDPRILITPRDAIFRINRDTRFSADKSPYKTNVGALISPLGKAKKEFPGYYFHLEPGKLFLGGGAYFLEKEMLERVRRYILLHTGEFSGVMRAPAFEKVFGPIQGEAIKRIPAEHKAVFEKEPLIANKQFYYMAEWPDSTVEREDLAEWAAAQFRVAKGVNDLLERVMV